MKKLKKLNRTSLKNINGSGGPNFICNLTCETFEECIIGCYGPVCVPKGEYIPGNC
ncbi:bacteriocin-like protein [Chryseobacterium sp. C-71]|uniref:bacteriocin-like protein n=1 Tax=Chryseobacterium sp. C-71 TaxID=2893882 RepID=UPI0038B345FE